MEMSGMKKEDKTNTTQIYTNALDILYENCKSYLLK